MLPCRRAESSVILFIRGKSSLRGRILQSFYEYHSPVILGQEIGSFCILYHNADQFCLVVHMTQAYVILSPVDKLRDDPFGHYLSILF